MTEETPTIVEVNCTTGEETVRPYNAEELAQRNADIAAYEIEKAERDAAAEALAALKASAKAKLVAGTPLTEAEAATIVL